MRVNLQFNTNSYKSTMPFYANRNNQNTSAPEVNNGHISLKRMLQDAQKEQKNPFNSPFSATSNNSILSASMSYSEKLKAQRENMKNASLEKKKLRYQFKDISSQIIRSKTSLAARQAVGQAKRELLRLKQEKQSGKYDPEEIEAAINHAKSMERVAKKKVKHLEEEEMAKASGGPCSDAFVSQEEKLREETENADDMEKLEDGYSSLEDEMMQEGTVQEATYDLGELSGQMASYDDMSLSLDEMDAMFGDMEELTEDMMEEMSEGMQDMLEEMGLGELTDSLMAAKGDMDPEDLKMMKIKHRCKEMKEIVEADAEYLKAIFKYLEEMKSGGAGMSMSGVGNNAMSFASAQPQVRVNMPAVVSAVAGGEPAATLSIDVSI